MVRVISVHHFANQFVQVVEQPTACTIAPPNRLLLALMNNCVEVRDLSKESDVLFSFPTVDEVVQIVHCLNGDYVATLETKFNRQNKELNFVRVYINWDSVAALQQSKMTSSGVSLGSSECGMVQPMRARIAGRVTPTTNQSELGSLEMIEIPVTRNPSTIDCCQVSGNLLILSDNFISIYVFQIKTHDISKMRFIDFEEIPFIIELSFSPIQVAVCENYIACFSKESMYLFKISECDKKEPKVCQDCLEIHEEDFTDLVYSGKAGPVDYKQLVREQSQKNTKNKITVNFPTIVKENSIVHRNSPFMFTDKDLHAEIKQNQYKGTKVHQIESLIQLKLIPVLIENAQRQVTEEFKSIILKPLYIEQSLNRSCGAFESRFLRSDFDKSLNSIVCIVATQQEGYLYHFDDINPCTDTDNCLAIYPFTAPVFKLVMEESFLHALTETGLETYTLRYGHQMCRNIELMDLVNVACPPISDPICLVGLRPFLGVEQILLSENFLVLLANSETSPAHSVSSNSSSNASFLTLYNLELPSNKTVFNDICIVANVHRFTSVNTYCHLMSEAHMILRMALLLKKWSITEDNIKLILPKESITDDSAEVYRITCALLGDHFIMEQDLKDYSLAIPYYKMARVSTNDIFKRVKKIQEQSGNHSNKGLIHYLKKKLFDIKSGPEADKLFGTNSKQFFSESIFELLVHHSYDDLPNLILKSKIIREYSTDRLIGALTEKTSETTTETPAKYLALAVLYIQKCNTNKAQEQLERITDNLRELILENHDLLFETTQTQQNRSKTVTTFSELTVLLVSLCPELLASILVNLILEQKVISLSKMIKVFLEYLPSSIGSNSNSASIVLQRTLETYFEKYFSRPENIDLNKVMYERGTCEALKLLVRSYLSQLQIIQIKGDSKKEENNSTINKNLEKELFDDENDDTQKDHFQEKLSYNQINKTFFDEVKHPKATYLFSILRYEYLDKMPPFQVEITSKLYEVCLENYPSKETFQPNEEADQILRKLQALLCSNIIPKQIVTEVNGFLSVNENLRGNVSLQSITMSTNDSVLLLIDACPQCLVQFGKNRFTRTDEWKFLIATVQRRILRLSQNENLTRICFFHKKILKDILTHVASSMTLDQLIQVFPQRFSTSKDEVNNKDGSSENLKLAMEFTNDDLDILNEIQNYEPYVLICKETMHANQIRQLINATANQLLLTLSF